MILMLGYSAGMVFGKKNDILHGIALINAVQLFGFFADLIKDWMRNMG